MREKRRIATLASESPNIKTKRWVFYDAMEFLIPHVTPRTTSSNVPSPPDDNSYDVDDAAPEDVHSQQTANNANLCEGGSRSTPATNQLSSTAKEPNANKRRRHELANEVDVQIVRELQKLREQVVCKNENELDPDRQYLLSLLPLMKQLSPVDSIGVKIEIHQAFRKKLVKDQDFSYGYWPDQRQQSSYAPSPYASDSNSDQEPLS
ncbi:hypothetical protein E2C01_089106 [Portunus trituberculatus]|uniref:BESS domain-containing protein n=1 Tax=Portunus trituberculatus TaxID=210409 RepID=A0A5B7JLL9_PORTR|nr:hypothetical protein [Portunus trituberculatus]